MIRLQLPSHLAYRDLAVRTVAAACRLVACSGWRAPSAEFQQAVVSAFGEAFNQVASQSPGGTTDREIELEIDVSPDGIVLRLLDHAASFDGWSLPPPRLDDLPVSGLGFFIIRSMMDEVTYRAGRPNMLSMTKRFHPPALSEVEAQQASAR
ncbi:MAG: ATP-binding protein [Myxococcales bacterium]|nr:ATP-binding protein [Myxococcales bacterium]